MRADQIRMSTQDAIATELRIAPIPAKEVEPWLLARHYAKRMCSISYAFGAYRGTVLVGVVTYGTPASPHLCRGVCGDQWTDKVLELNRLCCETTRNVASTLVGRSLRLLPKPSVVVSYADTAQGHVGYIYQATNFIYTGQTDSDRKTPRGDRITGVGHSRHDGRMNDGTVDKTIGIVRRLPKHRYVFPCGTAKQRERIIAALRYSVKPYPKGESIRYDSSAQIETQDAFVFPSRSSSFKATCACAEFGT